jgi:hypothetical protein
LLEHLAVALAVLAIGLGAFLITAWFMDRAPDSHFPNVQNASTYSTPKR